MTVQKQQTANDFDFSIADGTNQDYMDVYPRLQWHHGKKQFAKLGGVVHTGGMFIPADQFPNFNAEGWVEDSFTSSKNEEIKGYSTTKAYLAIIRVKTWWSESDDGKKSSQTHMLCCVKDIDGVFSLQVGGVSKGMPMNRAFADHRNQIVAMVNRTKPVGTAGFEPFALWFVVEPGPHDAQVSAKNASASSEVTRPQLYTPENIDLDYARTLWVGPDNYKLFCQIYKDTEAWQLQFPKSQIHDDPDAPAFTGNVNGITQSQIDMIAGIIEVKGLDITEIREMCMIATDGATDQIPNLTRDEAATLIETVKTI